jgi:DNA-binding NarL/FixJ family response regulator
MGHKVLIVDDTLFMRKMLADCLTQNGYEVAGEASNGKEAIQRYEELRPDVVMMDINMPEMSGIEAIKEILKLDNNAVILVCTAVNQQDLILEAMEVGAKGYVMKPFKPNRVLEIIQKYAIPNVSPNDDENIAPVGAALEGDSELVVAEESNYEEKGSTSSVELLIEAVSENGLSVEEEHKESLQMDESFSLTRAPLHSEILNIQRRNIKLRSFVSSIMCNWQEEINGETATFIVVCTESENKVLIEMSSDNQVKHTMQFTLDGLRQLGGWLEDHVGRA